MQVLGIEQTEHVRFHDNLHGTPRLGKARSRSFQVKLMALKIHFGILNSLTAIDGHDRQYFNELRSTVVSREFLSVRRVWQLVERAMTSVRQLFLAIFMKLS